MKERINLILEKLTGILDEYYIKEVKYYLNYNEVTLAIEMLCEHLVEELTLNELHVNVDILIELKDVCIALKIEELYYRKFFPKKCFINP